MFNPLHQDQGYRKKGLRFFVLRNLLLALTDILDFFTSADFKTLSVNCIAMLAFHHLQDLALYKFWY